MSIRMRMTVAVMFLTAAVACGKGSSPTAPTPTTVTATIVSSGFTPNPINISVGSTVTWMNSDTIAHVIVADNAAFSSGTIASGAQFGYACPSAGMFTYHDASNPNMAGTVNVSGSSSSPSPY
jgi:plastocyanin